MISSMFYSRLAQYVFAAGAPAALTIRALSRMDTIPEDRQADYAFRDIYMSIINGIMINWTFRLMESVYTIPKFVQAFGLHNLSKEYAGVPGAKDYARLPLMLERRMLGLLVNEKSFHAIPDLMRNYDLKKLKLGSAEYKEGLVLAEQLQRRLDQPGYLKTYYGFSDEQAATFSKLLHSVDKRKLPQFTPTAAGATPAQTSETKNALEQAIAKHQEELRQAFKGGGWRQQMFAHKNRLANKTGLELLHDAVTSRQIQEMVRFTRKTGSWTSMIGGLVLNFLYFGVLATWFDFNVLQPWQKKLSETRGTTREVVAPMVWSLIPGGLATAAMQFATRKMPGYATRFMATFGTGFLVYSLSILALVKNKLSKPPTGKAARLAAQSRLEHTPHHIKEHAAHPSPRQHLADRIPFQRKKLNQNPNAFSHSAQT